MWRAACTLAALLLTIVSPASAPMVEWERLHLPDFVRSELADAGWRSFVTKMEEAYCLTGKQKGRVMVIASAIKPIQTARVDTTAGLIVYQVTRKTCPTGTVADAHTHPVPAPLPSHIDTRGWLGSHEPHRVHLIIFPTPWGMNASVWRVHAQAVLPVDARQIRFYFTGAPHRSPASFVPEGRGSDSLRGR